MKKIQIIAVTIAALAATACQSPSHKHHHVDGVAGATHKSEHGHQHKDGQKCCGHEDEHGSDQGQTEKHRTP